MATQFASISPHALVTPVRPGRVRPMAGRAIAAVTRAIAALPREAPEPEPADLTDHTSTLSDWDRACETLEAAVEARDTFDRDMLKPIEAMADLLASQGHDVSLLEGPYGERSRQYGDLVGEVSKATSDLAAIAAPNAAGLAYKVRALVADEFHLNTADNTPIVEAIDADAKAVLDAATARNPFMRGPLIQWQKAYAEYEQAARDAEAYFENVIAPADKKYQAVLERFPESFDFSTDPQAASELAAADYRDLEATSSRLWSECTEARLRLYLSPAPSALELGVKLKIFDAQEDHELVRSDEVIRQMMFDARRFGRMGSHPVGDEALNEAFAGLRKEALVYLARPDDTTAQEDNAADLRVDALENIVHQTRASTLEGVLAKLRVAFQRKVGEQWTDLAVVDPSDPKFVHGLKMADMFDEVFWSAIEDLARIAGVNLAEQGA